ncbi:MAG TPA: MFS transporter, partial [Tepidisphaeraceae bacterium]
MSDSQPPIFTPAHDPYAALRSRDYRLFAGAGFLSVVGGQILSITALYEVYQKTNSKMSLGWVGAALAVPMLVLALPAGHYADHHSRRRISVVTLLVAVVTAVALAALSHYWHDWIHSVGAIYVLLMLGNAAATFGRPARTALLPQLVPPEIFANAVTWNTSLFETASMIGPLIGGYLCAWNIAAAYLLTAILWVVSAILLAALPELPPSTPRNSRPAFADLIAGLKFVFST